MVLTYSTQNNLNAAMEIKTEQSMCNGAPYVYNALAALVNATSLFERYTV